MKELQEEQIEVVEVGSAISDSEFLGVEEVIDYLVKTFGEDALKVIDGPLPLIEVERLIQRFVEENGDLYGLEESFRENRDYWRIVSQGWFYGLANRLLNEEGFEGEVDYDLMDEIQVLFELLKHGDEVSLMRMVLTDPDCFDEKKAFKVKMIRSVVIKVLWRLMNQVDHVQREAVLGYLNDMEEVWCEDDFARSAYNFGYRQDYYDCNELSGMEIVRRLQFQGGGHFDAQKIFVEMANFPPCAFLEQLDLGNIVLDDETKAALLKFLGSEYLENLRKIVFTGIVIDQDVVAALAGLICDGKIEVIDLENCFIADDVWAEINSWGYEIEDRSTSSFESKYRVKVGH